MNFYSNLADTIPVVGHVKGVIHYATGDTEGGNRAMYQATRTTAVLGAGAAGSLAGPGGAVVAAMYAGAVTDSVASVAMDKPQGFVKGCKNIAEDINEGKNPMGSIASTGFQVGMDAIGGLGMGGVSSAASQVTGKTVAKGAVKTVGEKAIEKTVKMTGEEVVKTVTKTVTVKAVKKVIETAAVQAEIALVSTHICNICKQADESTKEEERKKRDRERREREERERRDREERQRRDREQREREERERRDREPRTRVQLQQRVREQEEQCSTPESNSGSSQPPQGNRNNNDQPRKNKPNYFAIFKNLLEEILDVIFGVERPYTRARVSISQIFRRISKAKKDYLEKIIERLYKGGILIEVLIIVIRIFSEHFPGDISFRNFLSLTEFVAVYIEEEIDYRTEVFRMAERISRENDSSIPEEEFENLRARIIWSIMNLPDIVTIIVDIIVRLRVEIESELLPFEISELLLVSRELSSNFRDVFSAIYHHFKHRCVPGDGVLSVREYYDWIRRVLEELGRHKDYRNLLQVRNTEDVRANVKFEMFVVIFGRRIRIVVRLPGDTIGLATCYFIDDMTDGEGEGTVSIDIRRL